ncbi:hypothetical protein CWB96_11795 [Pseudoalteromonas citrea]|uniref:ParB/Sulfiredoxin domain-containing protein n=1 Tax=Pseudoalteromonas citrea TaxID=43655 RepID=A0A5S3XNP0_9GAMM|nr:hypothetical protein [Pseudoalteromonas citrea]TMP43889.1 hypothetical protein CWB97_07695 [Pseudoalteromonas citrea]TMP58552.1 hypothetical protein CWB96_11795 [Pseudoalteromonas citrea]
MTDKLDQLILANVNNKELLHTESYEYKSLFLSTIIPDESNARFMPCIFIEDEHAKQFITRSISKHQLSKLYNAENHVLIGKSCIINCLKYGTNEWKKANATIESIVELGENIAVSEMIQAPTVFPTDDGNYQILTGHRRFFALVFAYGFGHVAQFKVYDNKPLLSKVKQFQENASREDLPQYGKLQAFLSAMMEIDALDQARLKVGDKKLTVKDKAKNLGISMGAFDNYNVLTRYPEVINTYEKGLSNSFISTKKIVLSIENDYKSQHDKKLLNLTDRKRIGELIEQKLTGTTSTAKKASALSIKNISSASVLQTLLFKDVSKLDLNINWQEIDWNNTQDVNSLMAKLVTAIAEQEGH